MPLKVVVHLSILSRLALILKLMTKPASLTYISHSHACQKCYHSQLLDGKHKCLTCFNGLRTIRVYLTTNMYCVILL